VLGSAISVAQGWAQAGKSVSLERRTFYAPADGLNRWLGRECASPFNRHGFEAMWSFELNPSSHDGLVHHSGRD
jgi:hypothetical protein